MDTHAVVFIAALVGGLIATPLCGALAARLGVLDVPNARKVHTRPTPLLGGVAVFAAFAVPTVLFLQPVIPVQLTLLLLGAAAFAAIGLFDDVRNVGAPKFALESAVVVAIVVLGGFRADLPWPYVGEALAVVWIVGVANAFNCLDSTDGVASGAAAISSVAIAAAALALDRGGVAIVAFALAGACLGFLRYNFAPARIFLGDAGSLMLGFLLGALSAALVGSKGNPAVHAVPLLIMAVPVVDFLVVHYRRFEGGIRNPIKIMTSAAKDHLPHRLLAQGLSVRQTAISIYALTALTGTCGALIVSGPAMEAPLAAAAAIFGAATVALGFHKSYRGWTRNPGAS
jgi:UDP-GlcNAc:undecaprenyl-phosphate GlcNAc-1-phosphate transferase